VGKNRIQGHYLSDPAWLLIEKIALVGFSTPHTVTSFLLPEVLQKTISARSSKPGKCAIIVDKNTGDNQSLQGSRDSFAGIGSD
jgi:hypothetical protein